MRDSSGKLIAVEWADSATPEPERAFRDEEAVDNYWRALAILRTPFQSSEGQDYRDLVDVYRQLEAVFIEDPELRDYYEECTRGAGPRREATKPAGAAENVDVEPHIRHVVMLQAQFMEDAHYVLRLDRYANAPDNRGWMNLFRAWSRSPRFRAAFRSMRRFFTRDFNEFYDAYIGGDPAGMETIDRVPVPHPWDTRPAGREAVPGIYLDSGIREGLSPRLLRLVRQRPAFTSGVEAGEHGAPGAKEGGGESSAPGGIAAPPPDRSPPPGSNQ